MSDLHRLGAEVGLALALLAAAWSAVTLALRRPLARLAIVNLAWVSVVVTVTALVGLAALVTGPGPGDVLHLLYGAIALVALPLTAWIAAGRAARDRVLAALIGSTVELILVVRLFQTGG